jgi:hypothetical protein
VGSLLFSLVTYLIIYFNRKSKSQATVPLAGLQSVYLSIWILFIVGGLNLFSYGEFWLNKLFGYDY